jgi:2-haloacid dehalogenase
MAVSGIKALAFDTGGTVLDWHGGVRAALAEAGARHGIERDWTGITNAYRRRALQLMTERERPGFNIADVHRKVLDELAVEHNLDMLSKADRTAIVRRWHSLDAWSDFPPALQRLRNSYIVVSFTILSVSLIIDTARRNGLCWDAVISCEMLGVYKPRPEAYRQAARLLQLTPGSILMVACHNFDLDAARGVGYRTGFVHRPDEWGPAGPPDPVPNPATDLVVTDFAQLADRMGCEPPVRPH